MKGSNELTICQAEMVAGMEHYLNEHVFKEAVKVKSVAKKSTSQYSDEFVIVLESDLTAI